MNHQTARFRCPDCQIRNHRLEKRHQPILAVLLAAILLTLVLTPTVPVQAYLDIEQNRTFIFDQNGRKITIPTTYNLIKTISVIDPDGVLASEVQDFYVTSGGDIYILDMAGGRIFVYNSRYILTGMIDQFRLVNGDLTSLNKPEGIFVDDDGLILIADTQNERILKVDASGQVLAVTNKPPSFQGIAIESFYPIKVVADNVGRLSVVARNINMGLLQFDANGNFTGYSGAPKVKVNLLTKMWKMVSTKAQKAQMDQFVPTEYSNIDIDAAGFIYGSISSIAQTDVIRAYQSNDKSGQVTPIKKLNSMGADVLKRNGKSPPLGNVDLQETNSVSRMVDVALGPAGSYTLLDNSTGTLYTYSDEGILLHAFGSKGKSKRSFERPVAIEYLGDNLLVLDSLLAQVSVFAPTAYYQVVMDAISAEYSGDFDLAYEKWGEITRQNANFSYAYTGLGKIELDNGNYRAAMDYFEYAMDTKNYSKAKEKLRKENMSTAFPIIFFTLLLLSAALFSRSSVRKVRRYFRERS
jgi:tetratricopeptide (TPR) repeat protein